MFSTVAEVGDAQLLGDDGVKDQGQGGGKQQAQATGGGH
jgi:hypothetical protein